MRFPFHAINASFSKTLIIFVLVLHFGSEVSAKNRSAPCLPEFDLNPALFEPCLRFPCLLFKESPPFVRFRAQSRPPFGRPFECKSRLTEYEGLRGIPFDILHEIPQLEDAYCILLSGECSYNDLTRVLDDMADLEWIGMTIDLMFLVPYRLTATTKSSVPYFHGNAVVYGLRKNVQQSLKEVLLSVFRQGTWIPVAVWIVLLALLRVVVIWRYQSYKFNRYTGRRWFLFWFVTFLNLYHDEEEPSKEESAENDCRIEVDSQTSEMRKASFRFFNRMWTGTFTFTIAIFVILFEISIAVNIWDPSWNEMPLPNMSNESLREFVVLGNTASEYKFQALVDPNGRFSANNTPWQLCVNESQCIKKIRDPGNPAKFGFTYDMFLEYYWPRSQGVEDEFMVFQARAKLPEYYAVWYFNKNVPDSLALAINHKLSDWSENLIDHWFTSSPILEKVEAPSYEEHCGKLSPTFGVWGLFHKTLLHWARQTNGFIRLSLSEIARIRHVIVVANQVIGAFLVFLFGFTTSRIAQLHMETSEKTPRVMFPDSQANAAGNDFRAVYNWFDVELQKHGSSLSQAEIDELEDMALSEYLSHEKLKFPGFMTPTYGNIHWKLESLLDDLDNEEYSVVPPEPSCRRLLVKSKIQNSFLVLTDDFFIAYDSFDEMFRVRVRGSPCVCLKYTDLRKSKLEFQNLIGNFMPIQQVYLLVRRFVQFTGAKWEYDCLAQIEMALPGATVLQLPETRLFQDITIELNPMCFDCLSGCRVGYLAVDDKSYNVGMHTFGSIIGFRRTESHVADPFVCTDAQFEDLKDYTDCCKLVIGGREHETNQEQGSNPQEMNQPSLIARVMVFFRSNFVSLRLMVGIPCNVPGRNDENCHRGSEAPTLRAMKVRPESLSLCAVMGCAIFNLAPIPKNAMFKELNSKKRYSAKDLKEMESDFIKLGYGTQFAGAIRECVSTNALSSHFPITLAEAQHLLLKEWDKLTHRTKVAISLTSKRYLKRDMEFLLLNSGKLFVVSSTKRYMGSISAGFGAKVLGVGPSVNIHGMVSDDDLIVKSTLTSVLDAAEKISGHRTGFEKFADGRGYIPTRQGMEKILGALTLVCRMLENRVMAKGRFQNCVHVEECAAAASSGQEVDIDLPIPCGVLCSTLARSVLEKEHWLLVDGDWGTDRDFEYPLYIGDGECDIELCNMVAKYHFC